MGRPQTELEKLRIFYERWKFLAVDESVNDTDDQNYKLYQMMHNLGVDASEVQEVVETYFGDGEGRHLPVPARNIDEELKVEMLVRNWDDIKITDIEAICPWK